MKSITRREILVKSGQAALAVVGGNLLTATSVEAITLAPFTLRGARSGAGNCGQGFGLIMTNQSAIEVVAKFGGEGNSIAWAILKYYMEKDPRQTEWRKIPGIVIGTDKKDAMSKAEAIARELNNLDILELRPAVRKLYANQKMFRRIEMRHLNDIK